MSDTLLPKTYDYKEIDRLIGHGLWHQQGLIVEHYEPRHVVTHEDFYIAADEYPEDRARDLDHRVREIADCGREEALGRYPPNDFRYVSRIQRDGPGHYWFEIALTERGQRALHCSKNAWCCDEDGHFNAEATERFYLERANALHLTSIEFNKDLEYRDIQKWIDEPWAHKIKQAYDYYVSGIAPMRSGQPDYEKTVRTWYYNLVSNGRFIDAPEKISKWFAKGYCREWRDAKWAQPLMKALTLSEKLIRADEAGEPDYEATVRYWLGAPRDEIVKCKNTLLALDDDWALPIQGRLMEILMKQPKVRILG